MQSKKIKCTYPNNGCRNKVTHVCDFKLVHNQSHEVDLERVYRCDKHYVYCCKQYPDFVDIVKEAVGKS
jgi:hypothetical protein